MKRPHEDDANVAHVADHYNSRQNLDRHERRESPIFNLKGFNNWVKSVLIALHATPGMRVLDLAGGKGGDLAKWRKADISHLVLADVAHVSVQHALERYVSSAPPFPALFVATDCFATRFLEQMDPAIRFDLVSCQFAFHYAFETEQRLRTALSNLTNRLEPGGYFLGTIPNALRLVRLIRSVPGNTWSNSICKLEFDPSMDKDCFPEFGARYSFTLADAVDSVPEYLVHPAVFERVAAEYGLELVLRKELPDWKRDYCKDPRFEDLLRIMRVNRLSPDEWQAASLYVVFCFRKTGVASEKPKEKQQQRYQQHDYKDVIRIV